MSRCRCSSAASLHPKAGKGFSLEGSDVLTGFNGAPGYFASRNINFADADYFYPANDPDAGLSWVDTGGGIGGLQVSARGLYTFTFTAELRGVLQGSKFSAYAGVHPDSGHMSDLSLYSRMSHPLLPKGDGTFEAIITFVTAGPWLLEVGESVRLQSYILAADQTSNCGSGLNITYWFANGLRVG